MSIRGSRLLVAATVISMAMAPVIADARVGGGSSQGSRGSHTNSAPPATRTAPTTAQPMERSMAPAASSQATRPGMAPAAAAAPARSGFMSGMMGGIIGVGIGSLLFGGGMHGFFGGGAGIMGMLSILLQIGIAFFVGRFLWRMFMRTRQPATAGGPDIIARGNMQPQPGPMPMGGSSLGAPPPLAIGPQDFQHFEQLLTATQAAWSARDLNALRGMATPEMVTYFADQLADHASRGVVNTVSAVHLDSGDLSEAWAEGGRDFASVAMKFSMLDVTKDVSGRVVDGSPTERSSATEVWTFTRSQGGQWILSAIQQAR